MLEGKALVQDTDMPGKMQIQAMDAASKALDLYDVFDCKSIAAHIKKVLSLSPSPSFDVYVGGNGGLQMFFLDFNSRTVLVLCMCRRQEVGKRISGFDP